MSAPLSRSPIDRAIGVLARKVAPLVGAALVPYLAAELEKFKDEVRADVNGRIDSLRADLRAAEAAQRASITRATAELRDANSLEELDRGLRELGRRVINGRPNSTYLNVKLRDLEFAALDVKQIGYYLAEQIAAANLQRPVAAPPSTSMKISLCKQSDLESDWGLFWARALTIVPYYHRKWWECAYICQALWSAGMLAPGKRGLCFGCGNEALPSLFVKYGARILATDLDPGQPEAQGWLATGQHSAGQVEVLRRPDICPDVEALERIDFRFADMNNIPRDLDGSFDFCWSTCALEHLGSRTKGMEFIENSLRTLRSGGIAVHTTEFMINEHEDETIDYWPSVFYRKSDIIELAESLTEKGYIVAPIDLDPGEGFLDKFYDIPPFYSNSSGRIFDKNAGHLKVVGDGFALTCIGIAVSLPA
jgi:SAM-dependent methyltransferase